MSSKKEQREARRQAKRQVRCKCRGAGCERCDAAEFVTPVEIVRRAKVVVAPLEPRTEAQKRYIAAMRTFPLVFGVGPAGAGKTYVVGAIAADQLLGNHIERIVITRPVVEAGESMGFLPGEIDQKYAPYVQPFRDVLNERIGTRHVENLLKNGRIEAAPLAYMRGRTFKNAFVILDEAQNTTPAQMRLFLTRIGEGCQVVVNGDESQSDIRGTSGLTDAIERVSWIPSVKVVRFTRADIVRSGLVQEIVESYERPKP